MDGLSLEKALEKLLLELELLEEELDELLLLELDELELLEELLLELELLEEELELLELLEEELELLLELSINGIDYDGKSSTSRITANTNILSIINLHIKS